MRIKSGVSFPAVALVYLNCKSWPSVLPADMNRHVNQLTFMVGNLRMLPMMIISYQFSMLYAVYKSQIVCWSTEVSQNFCMHIADLYQFRLSITKESSVWSYDNACAAAARYAGVVTDNTILSGWWLQTLAAMRENISEDICSQQRQINLCSQPVWSVFPISNSSCMKWATSGETYGIRHL